LMRANSFVDNSRNSPEIDGMDGIEVRSQLIQRHTCIPLVIERP
jgi:hypothetical protein